MQPKRVVPVTKKGSTWNQKLTEHTMVESMLFPRHFHKMTFNQCEIDVELTSVPSGRGYSGQLKNPFGTLSSKSVVLFRRQLRQ